MPVPVAASVTVTSALVAVESVAVRVRLDPAFSAIDEAEDESVTVGADSFSVIVTVVDCVPLSVAEPPDTLSIATLAFEISALHLSASTYGGYI